MARSNRLKFGIFLAPFHRFGENPTLSLERDLELIEWLDSLGYDEAWVGEHHSAGWETIASPEVFIGFAASRTKQIKLGTGVVSLPYHHPMMVAEPDGVTGPPDPRSGDPRGRARRAAERRGDARHRADPPARHDGRVARHHPALARRRGADHLQERLVRAARGAAAPPVLHPAATADRGRAQPSHQRVREWPASTDCQCSPSAPMLASAARST